MPANEPYFKFIYNRKGHVPQPGLACEGNI